MTIEDSLILLNNTKQSIKAAIESKGVTVGSVPFSDYADKIMDITTGPLVTLDGPTVIEQNITVTYTITNYSSFSTYSVSVTAGTASIVGNTITFNAPASEQTVVLTVTVDGKQENFSIEIVAPVAIVMGVALLAEGGDGGTWAHIDANGNTVSTPNTAWFNSHPVWGGIQDVTIDGQAMIKIPKFYIRRATISGGANNGKEGFWISDQPVAGYELHPAFMDGGNVIDQIYVGKYQASMTGAKLDSKPGVLPTVNRSLTQFIADANARNVGGVSGFMLWSVYQWAAIQWLYLVENATMDSQAKTGQGLVSASSAANVDASDVAQATYRGIVGLWGNVRQWIDGLKTTGGAIHVWDREGNKSWINTGRRRTAAAGAIYPTTFMDHSGPNYDFADMFIGDTGPTSNSNATAPDSQYFNEDNESFPNVGGNWNNEARAGLWFVDCGNAASTSGVNIGARLAKV